MPFRNQFAAGEWRVLAWLEREGFTYDVIGCEDLDEDPGVLAGHTVLILSTHSEYWSKPMYSAVSAFNASGGSVLNLSGNSIFRQAEFLDDDRVRFVNHGLHEWRREVLSLLGVAYDDRGLGTAAPYQVLLADHWVFGQTKASEGELFASETLNVMAGQGGSGQETDKVVAGSPNDVVLLARGTNDNDGGASMTIREPIDGSGTVFSASSMQFGGCLLVDDVASQVVRNVLEATLGQGQAG